MLCSSRAKTLNSNNSYYEVATVVQYETLDCGCKYSKEASMPMFCGLSNDLCFADRYIGRRLAVGVARYLMMINNIAAHGTLRCMRRI